MELYGDLRQPPAALAVAGLVKRYRGAGKLALNDVSLDVPAGSFFSVLGPSGCGKTTLLRVLAGFEAPDTGRVIMGGVDVTGVSARERGIAMVFQDYALYPHMNVERNMSFGLRNAGVPRAEVQTRVRALAEMLGLGETLRRKPAALSGGERQRVALGRALIRRPRVFLLDEPLSNLDVKLREAMRIELDRLHKAFGITTVYVTHDQAEAMTLSTEVAVMRDGVVLQVGPPADLYREPCNVFVARFLGSPSMNLIRMRRQGAVFRIDGTEAAVTGPPWVAQLSVAEAIVGVRPHEWRRAADDEAGLPVVVDLVEGLGSRNYVICSPAGFSEQHLVEQDTIVVECPADVEFTPGERVVLRTVPAAVRVFSTDGVALRGGKDDVKGIREGEKSELVTE